MHMRGIEDVSGTRSRVVELQGLCDAIRQRCVCRECGGWPAEVRENLYRQEGLATYPYLFCTSCRGKDYISYSSVTRSSSTSSDKRQRQAALNRRSVLATKCAGGTHKSLQMYCCMLDFPRPVSRTMYTKVAHDVQKASSRQAQASMEQARHEVLQHYSLEVSEGEVPDILVSCDGTWQKRGFTSLYGACFVIAHETGKVVDYAVMSKYCVGCRRWDGKDKTSEDYLRWKAGHVCNVNYEGSSGGMEPHGTLKMFQRSLDFHLRYRYLISDGDSKSHNLILKSQPYTVKTVVCYAHQTNSTPMV